MTCIIFIIGFTVVVGLIFSAILLFTENSMDKQHEEKRRLMLSENEEYYQKMQTIQKQTEINNE